MLAWVVMNRRQPRRSAPNSSSLRTLCLCVKLSDPLPPAFPLVSNLPYVLPSSVSRNPFVCHSYENGRGVYQQFPFWNKLIPSKARSPRHSGFAESALHSPRSFLLKCFLFILLRTLLQSRKTQPFSFQSFPHSSSKTTRGGGRGLL